MEPAAVDVTKQCDCIGLSSTYYDIQHADAKPDARIGDAEARGDAEAGVDAEAGGDAGTEGNAGAGEDAEARGDAEAGVDAEAGGDAGTEGNAGAREDADPRGDAETGGDAEAGGDKEFGEDVETGGNAEAGEDEEAGEDTEAAGDVEAGEDVASYKKQSSKKCYMRDTNNKWLVYKNGGLYAMDLNNKNLNLRAPIEVTSYGSVVTDSLPNSSITDSLPNGSITEIQPCSPESLSPLYTAFSFSETNTQERIFLYSSSNTLEYRKLNAIPLSVSGDNINLLFSKSQQTVTVSYKPINNAQFALCTSVLANQALHLLSTTKNGYIRDFYLQDI